MLIFLFFSERVPGLAWFDSVCLVTTAGFVADQSIESFGTVFKGQTKPSDFFLDQMFCVGSR